MTTRDAAPVGAPCWVDLWTSDVAGSRRFYSELLGWEAQEPSPEFGGYFMFHRDGLPIAGGMGPMGDQPAGNVWTVILATDDIQAAVKLAESAGATVYPPGISSVGDLGLQTRFEDPTGAHVGAWQAGTFPGFTVLDEPGAPSWFELLTRDHDGAVDFYRRVFKWETKVVADTDDFRYTVMVEPGGGRELAGIGDARPLLPEGAPSHWSVYWDVTDVDASVAQARSLGGSVTAEPADTPYGRTAGVADPAGAAFKLRTPPA